MNGAIQEIKKMARMRMKRFNKTDLGRKGMSIFVDTLVAGWQYVSPKVSLSPAACLLVLVGVFALAASGDSVRRSHVFRSVENDVFYDCTIRIQALPNGEYNTIVFRNIYEDPERGVINAYNAYGVRVGQLRPLPGPAKVLRTKMVVFNGNVGAVFGAFRTAFHKAREWIGVGKKKGKTPSDMLDMNIEIPDGCALEIPNDEDASFVFRELSSSANLKQMKAGFKFWFSDKDRVLRFRCGDVTFDFRWGAEDDEKELICAEAACDENRLLQLYTGRPGEADLFRVGEKHKIMPLSGKSSEAPKWKSINGRSATLQFPNGMMAGMTRCSDESLNYFFCPYWAGTSLTEILVFPSDSYDEAYHAIEEAFKTALAWKSIAQKHRVLNIVKEMEIPCSKSAAIVITGRKGATDLLWKSVGDANQNVMPTKFWFSVETSQTYEKGKLVYKQEDATYCIRYGNDIVQKYLKLNDETLTAFCSLNPRLALRAMKAAVQGKDKEKSIFK